MASQPPSTSKPRRPFHTVYKVPYPGGVILINGDQVVKIDAQKVGEGWAVTLHLSDGNKHIFEGSTGVYFANTYVLNQ